MEQVHICFRVSPAGKGGGGVDLKYSKFFSSYVHDDLQNIVSVFIPGIKSLLFPPIFLISQVSLFT